MATIKSHRQEILRQLEADMEAYMDLASEIIVGEQKVLCPVDKGDLRAACQWRNDGRLHRQLFNNLEYAADVEFGSKPHVIRPKVKKALAFQAAAAQDIGSRKSLYRNRKSGKLQKTKTANTMVIVTKVQHPGTPAQPFMRPGVVRAKPKIQRILRRAGGGIGAGSVSVQNRSNA